MAHAAELTGIVVAAGASSRLGRPKQLVEHGGKVLVAVAVEKLVPHCARPVIVVTGAQHERVADALQNLPVRLVYNPAWREGIGASIRQGVGIAPTTARGLLLMLVDQPRISADDINHLVETWRAQPDRIAAACYDNRPGVPAIFPAAFRERLGRLHGDTGARKLLRDDAAISKVSMPAAAFDLDTPTDLAALLDDDESDTN